MISLKNILLKEYSEKKIVDTIERWRQEKADLDYGLEQTERGDVQVRRDGKE